MSSSNTSLAVTQVTTAVQVYLQYHQKISNETKLAAAHSSSNTGSSALQKKSTWEAIQFNNNMGTAATTV